MWHIERYQDIVLLLLNNGANIDMQDSAGNSALMIASRLDYLELVRLLLKRDAQIDLQDSDGRSALMIACQYEKHDVARLLLDRGANINLHDHQGDSALVLACSTAEPKCEVAELLLERGASLDLTREMCLRLYMQASMLGHCGIIKVLLEKGVPVSQQDDCGMSALMHACLYGRLEVVSLLLLKGIDVNQQNAGGISGLMYASTRSIAAVTVLLSHGGVQMNMRDKHGLSALLHASQAGQSEIISLLLKKGMNVSHQDEQGRSALMYASRGGYSSAVRLLLLRGVQIDQQDEDGMSALMYACREGNTKVVQVLLENGARVDLRAKSTKSAIELAAEKNQMAIVKLLEEFDKGQQEHIQQDTEIETENSEEIIEPAAVSKDDSEDTNVKDADQDGAISEEFIRGIQEAISKGGKIDRRLAHAMFIGPPGSGKSSLMDRLLQRLRTRHSHSTGVCNPIIIVDIDIDNPSTFHSVTVIDTNTWKEVEYDVSLVRQISKECAVTSTKKISMESSENLSSPSLATPVSVPKQNAAPANTKGSARILPDVSATINLSNSEIRSVVSAIAKKYGGYKDFHDFLTKSFSLYLRDTGGQVEFQEMISVLVFGPSIFFFVFRTDLEFQSKFCIEYRVSEGKPINCYTSSISTEEALLQCLASVDAMETTGTAGVKTHKPLVFIVGTHVDQLGISADEKIAKLNKHLDVVISSSGFESLVQYADRGKGQVMFAVDNTSEGDEDFKEIRSAVHNLISNRDEFSIEYPITYLLFSLELQNLHRSVLSLDECRTIAAKYGIVGDQVFHLLQFLHLRIGIIQYFDVDGLRHIILKEPQVLFNKVTNLIIRTFSCKALTTKEQKDFEKGILTADVLKSVVGNEGGITCHDFLKLLVHLRIITPYPSTTPDQEERYFIPCVLNHVQECSVEDLHTDILPLCIQFECKHCPKGLFGVLVTHLMTYGSDSESDTSFTLVEDKIFKDKVSFTIHSNAEEDEMSLAIFPTHLKLTFFPSVSPDRDMSIDKVCNNIRLITEKSILASLDHLHYNRDRVKPVMCFRCEQCSELHAVKKGMQYHKIFCKKFRINSRIPSDGCCWFNEEGSIEILPSHLGVVESSKKHSDFPEYVSSLPAHVRPSLEQQLDWDNKGVSKDLVTIADNMIYWEERLSTHLGLTDLDIYDIKKNFSEFLQRRETLQRWKNKQGLGATYKSLLELFVRAGQSRCAEAVCKVLSARK